VTGDFHGASSSRAVAEHERWNHNIHYHPVVLAGVPSGARRALHVGCGEGLLTRRLRAVVPQVTGIDLDPASIDLAREQDDPAHPIDYVLGDVLTYPFAPGSFEVVTSVATLHHMDAAAGLDRLRELLCPGGTLVVVGLARPDLPADLPILLAGALATRWYALTCTRWEQPSPTVWPPPGTFAGARRLADGILPGARYRRHLLWRYSLTWTKPTNPQVG